MSDNFFLQHDKAVTRYIMQHEAQAATPIPIMYRAHNPILHTDEQPFCSDMQCPCHDDKALYDRCVAIPLFEDGTLTIAEALRLFEGRQV